MKQKKLYFINMRHKETVQRLFKFELSEDQTVVSSPVALLKNIHTTYHQAKPDEGPMGRIAHVRDHDKSLEKSDTLLRMPQSTELVNLGSIFLDADLLGTSKGFEKNSYDEQYTLEEDFGNYLTFHFLQGRGKEIAEKIEALFNAKAVTYLVPHDDGFYISPQGTPETNSVSCVRIVFDPDNDVTVGALIAGVRRDFVVVGFPIQIQGMAFVAMSEEGKRYSRK